MKAWMMGAALALWAGAAWAAPSFSEYEAVTQLARELASDCRREVAAGPASERCDQFHDYLDGRYEDVSSAFRQHYDSVGAEAFSGVDPVRMRQHMLNESRLTSHLRYITERLTL